MLDAVIIDRIRRQRQERDSRRGPLHVEIPMPCEGDEVPARPEVGDPEDRGAIIVEDTV